MRKSPEVPEGGHGNRNEEKKERKRENERMRENYNMTENEES